MGDITHTNAASIEIDTLQYVCFKATVALEFNMVNGKACITKPLLFHGSPFWKKKKASPKKWKVYLLEHQIHQNRIRHYRIFYMLPWSNSEIFTFQALQIDSPKRPRWVEGIGLFAAKASAWPSGVLRVTGAWTTWLKVSEGCKTHGETFMNNIGLWLFIWFLYISMHVFWGWTKLTENSLKTTERHGLNIVNVQYRRTRRSKSVQHNTRFNLPNAARHLFLPAALTEFLVLSAHSVGSSHSSSSMACVKCRHPRSICCGAYFGAMAKHCNSIIYQCQSNVCGYDLSK